MGCLIPPPQKKIEKNLLFVIAAAALSQQLHPQTSSDTTGLTGISDTSETNTSSKSRRQKWTPTTFDSQTGNVDFIGETEDRREKKPPPPPHKILTDCNKYLSLEEI